MATWGLAEAKAKFSEVVERAERVEPQEITRNGKAVAMIVSREEWLKLNRPRVHNHRSMAEFFRDSPLVGSGLDLSRSRTKARRIEL